MSEIIQFESDPFWSFCFAEFCKFAKLWRQPKDLDRLVISFDGSGRVIVGNRDLLTILFDLAACPLAAVPKSEHADLLLACYRRSPDFTLELLAHLRETLARSSQHRRKFFTNPKLTPKQVKARLRKAVQLDAIGKERERLRSLDAKIMRLQRTRQKRG